MVKPGNLRDEKPPRGRPKSAIQTDNKYSIENIELKLQDVKIKLNELTDTFQINLQPDAYDYLKMTMEQLAEELRLSKSNNIVKNKIIQIKTYMEKTSRQIESCAPFNNKDVLKTQKTDTRKMERTEQRSDSNIEYTKTSLPCKFYKSQQCETNYRLHQNALVHQTNLDEKLNEIIENQQRPHNKTKDCSKKLGNENKSKLGYNRMENNSVHNILNKEQQRNSVCDSEEANSLSILKELDLNCSAYEGNQAFSVLLTHDIGKNSNFQVIEANQITENIHPGSVVSESQITNYKEIKDEILNTKGEGTQIEIDSSDNGIYHKCKEDKIENLYTTDKISSKMQINKDLTFKTNAFKGTEYKEANVLNCYHDSDKVQVYDSDKTDLVWEVENHTINPLTGTQKVNESVETEFEVIDSTANQLRDTQHVNGSIETESEVIVATANQLTENQHINEIAKSTIERCVAKSSNQLRDTQLVNESNETELVVNCENKQKNAYESQQPKSLTEWISCFSDANSHIRVNKGKSTGLNMKKSKSQQTQNSCLENKISHDGKCHDTGKMLEMKAIDKKSETIDEKNVDNGLVQTCNGIARGYLQESVPITRKNVKFQLLSQLPSKPYKNNLDTNQTSFPTPEMNVINSDRIKEKIRQSMSGSPLLLSRKKGTKENDKLSKVLYKSKQLNFFLNQNNDILSNDAVRESQIESENGEADQSETFYQNKLSNQADIYGCKFTNNEKYDQILKYQNDPNHCNTRKEINNMKRDKNIQLTDKKTQNGTLLSKITTEVIETPNISEITGGNLLMKGNIIAQLTEYNNNKITFCQSNPLKSRGPIPYNMKNKESKDKNTIKISESLFQETCPMNDKQNSNSINNRKTENKTEKENSHSFVSYPNLKAETSTIYNNHNCRSQISTHQNSLTYSEKVNRFLDYSMINSQDFENAYNHISIMEIKAIANPIYVEPDLSNVYGNVITFQELLED